MESTTAKRSVRRSLGKSVLAGIVAGMAMAIYAMIAASTYQDTGLFTPLYHIASSFIEPTAMETSMKKAMAGDLYYFSAGPAVLGLAIHTMTAIAFGVIFALLVTWLGIRGSATPVVGVAYGLAVFALMSVAVLPVMADLFGGGKAISDMPQMVGYTTFGIEHAIFGLVLGLMLTPRREYGPAPRARSAARSSPGADREPLRRRTTTTRR
jgi:hypothetical protein